MRYSEHTIGHRAFLSMGSHGALEGENFPLMFVNEVVLCSLRIFLRAATGAKNPRCRSNASAQIFEEKALQHISSRLTRTLTASYAVSDLTFPHILLVALSFTFENDASATCSYGEWVRGRCLIGGQNCEYIGIRLVYSDFCRVY
jgi:hypothetical protein